MKRHKHTLSNYHLLTGNMGELIPVGIVEALPGDTFQLSSSALIRVSPLAAPVMHPVSVRLHHFFVPHRLSWKATGAPGSWEDFITGGPDGMDTSSPPTLTTPASIEGTVLDYLGIPNNANNCTVSALPVACYNLIFNEWYRDQDLQSEVAVDNTGVLNVGWQKDYFTTSRPWTQKGPEITLPIGGSVPIRYGNNFGAGGAAADGAYFVAEEGSGGGNYSYGTSGLGQDSGITPNGFNANLFADLSESTQINVNDFRRGFALQRYEEARARYGSRYTEYLRYLGIRPSDARLQRPELLGGGTTRLNFSEVLQTAEAAANSEGRDSFGVGDLYGHGIAGMRTRNVRRFIEEHGYIMTLMSVRPRAIYFTGIPRSYLKTTKEDFWQKELEFIGQQEVLQNEIYAASANTEDDVFGYQDRYREYREQPSTVHGEFRSTLDYWHMARDLPANTLLNEDFIKCVPTTRIYNVSTNDVLWCMVNNHCVARRLVSRSAYARIL